jgi:hypothetical protein
VRALQVSCLLILITHYKLGIESHAVAAATAAERAAGIFQAG